MRIMVYPVSIGIITIQTVIGGDPHRMTSFQHVGDIQSLQDSQCRRDLLTHQLTILLNQPEQASVDANPGFAITLHITDTDLWRVTLIPVGTDMTDLSRLIEGQEVHI